MKRTFLIWLAVLGSLAAACAPSLPHAPTRPEMSDGFTAARVAAPPGMDDEDVASEVLRPGDVLRYRTLSRRPIEVESMRVDSSGRVSVPLVGAIRIAGLTLGEAAERIEMAIRPIDRFGRVLLELREAPGRRATVVGAVERPGQVALEGEPRLADLLALVGGPSRTVSDDQMETLADLGGARLIRDGVALPVSLTRALLGDLRHNVRVRPADLLHVPAHGGRQISVLGEVESARVVPFRRGMRLTEALARAGGLTRDAEEADVRVIRGSLTEPRVYRASVRGIADGNAPDVELAPGDVIFVSRELLADVGEVIDRVVPLLAGVALVAALVP